MPETGIKWVEKDKVLSFEEIQRIATILWNSGVKSIRLTGGEPTARIDIVKLCEMLSSKLDGIDLSMTTNGISLDKLAGPLKDAGLNRLNISLDTLDRQKFLELTRRDVFNQVISGIDMAIKVGFENIKINVVALNGINTDEKSLRDFISFSEEKGVEIRYIELMPFSGIGWDKGTIHNGGNDKSFISSKEIIQIIQQMDDLQAIPMEDPSQTSRIWRIRNGNASMFT
jgi:cyclic pyranopterin phosphate synthase